MQTMPALRLVGPLSAGIHLGAPFQAHPPERFVGGYAVNDRYKSPMLQGEDDGGSGRCDVLSGQRVGRWEAGVWGNGARPLQARLPERFVRWYAVHDCYERAVLQGGWDEGRRCVCGRAQSTCKSEGVVTKRGCSTGDEAGVQYKVTCGGAVQVTCEGAVQVTKRGCRTSEGAERHH